MRCVLPLAVLLCLGPADALADPGTRTVRFDHPPYGMSVEGDLAQLERPASELQNGCPGLITRAPTVVVEVEGGPARLVFDLGLAGIYDKVLVVRAGDQLICGTDEDSFQLTAGRVEIWIGGTEYSDHGRWELRITERPSLPGKPAAAKPDLRFTGEPLHAGGPAPDSMTTPLIYAGDLLAGCAIDVPQLAQHVLEVREPVDELRILARSDRTDLGLLVQRPDGSFTCGAKVYGDQPAVQERVVPGLYRIWIGRAGMLAARGDYSLAIEERPPGTLPASGPPHQPSWPHHARELVTDRDAARGEPLGIPGSAPLVRRGTAAGRVPTFRLTPTCVGHVTPEPSHALEVGERAAYLRLVAQNRGSGGASELLLVRTPDGRFYCAGPPDARGTAPYTGQAELELRDLPPGTYLLWLGTNNRSETDYTLAVMSEPGLSGEALQRLLRGR